jgi:hypothetical protein
MKGYVLKISVPYYQLLIAHSKKRYYAKFQLLPADFFQVSQKLKKWPTTDYFLKREVLELAGFFRLRLLPID